MPAPASSRQDLGQSAPIRLLELGTVSPLRSQTAYHAVAYAMGPESPDTVILVSPAAPYVCIGYHQDPAEELDLDYCRAQGLPVLRRETGGGAVYLDGDQIFVHWIVRTGLLPEEIEARFELFARPIVETYRELGVGAYFRPVNDIHVAGRKIGGMGAATLGAAEVVVGSLMLDFDKAAMSRVLKVPSEKMRDKVAESLAAYMTTLREELGTAPDRQALADGYIRHCAEALGSPLEPGAWTRAEEREAVRLDALFTSEEWLYQRAHRKRIGVTISGNVAVIEGRHKAPGGLIRATARLQEGRLEAVALTGDFTLLPAGALTALEEALEGATPEAGELEHRLAAVYKAHGIRSPGVGPEDFAAAVVAGAGHGSA